MDGIVSIGLSIVPITSTLLQEMYSLITDKRKVPGDGSMIGRGVGGVLGEEVKTLKYFFKHY